MNELKPCPHCGGTARYGKCAPGEQEAENDGAEYIECEKCGASTCLVFPIMDSAKPRLRDLWNQRAEAELLTEALRDEMDEGLRLRDLGGAKADENITAMTERVIQQRLNLAAMLRKCAHALKNRGREDLAADVVGLLRAYDLLGSPLRDGQP